MTNYQRRRVVYFRFSILLFVSVIFFPLLSFGSKSADEAAKSGYCIGCHAMEAQ